MPLDKKHPATAWLAVSILSMMFMGVYAFLIALSRAPGFNQLFSDQEFFKTALVTHVVLSVVIWFLAYIIFVMYYVTRNQPVGAVDYLPAAGALIGVALIVATPFTGPAKPMLNNYVPVLQRGIYFTGLSIFLASSTIGVAVRAPSLLRLLRSSGGRPVVPGSLLGAGFALGVAVICFLLALWKLSGAQGVEKGPIYFEFLFWGGGHVLQFANTMGLMAVWGLLAARVAGQDAKPVGEGAFYAVLGVMTLFVLSAPFEYFFGPVPTMEHRNFFLELKRWGTAAGPIVIGAAVWRLAPAADADPVARRGLYLSIILFAIGGLLALTIHGSDTRVPAHYHGVIGAVTLCFMAFALVVSSDSGWLAVSQAWKKRQLTLYGVGQTLFASGLFIGGQGGLPRKTFGTAQQLDTALKVTGMSVMGIGGLLAVAGGVIFVVFMLMALFGRGKA